MDTRLAKRNYSIQQWKAIIQGRNNTKLTVDEYCKQNGMTSSIILIFTGFESSVRKR